VTAHKNRRRPKETTCPLVANHRLKWHQEEEEERLKIAMTQEIPHRCQFHQLFSCTFFADILVPKRLKAERFSFVIFGAKIFAKNAHKKC
jgi:hypothetical protein